MGRLLRLILWGSILLLPQIAQAQRWGYSVGMPAIGSAQRNSGTAAASSGAQTPALPALPSLLPSGAPSSLQSLPLDLKPLNLTSMHMAPPPLVLLGPPRQPVLTAVPFPMDPIAAAMDPITALGAPEMCVDPTMPFSLKVAKSGL